MASSSNQFMSLSWADALDSEVRLEAPVVVASPVCGAGSQVVPEVSGPYGMSIKDLNELYRAFIAFTMKELVEDTNTFKHLTSRQRNMGDKTYIVSGPHKGPGTSTIDLFFKEQSCVEGVTGDFRRQNQLASLFINGRDLLVTDKVIIGGRDETNITGQLKDLEFYLPGAKCLKRRVASRLDEIVNNNFRGNRSFEIVSGLDPRVLVVCQKMVITINPVSMPSLGGGAGTTTMLKSIMADAASRVSSKAPIATMCVAPTVAHVTPAVVHSIQAPVVAPVTPVTPSPTTPESSRFSVITMLTQQLATETDPALKAKFLETILAMTSV